MVPIGCILSIVGFVGLGFHSVLRTSHEKLKYGFIPIPAMLILLTGNMLAAYAYIVADAEAQPDPANVSAEAPEHDPPTWLIIDDCDGHTVRHWLVTKSQIKSGGGKWMVTQANGNKVYLPADALIVAIMEPWVIFREHYRQTYQIPRNLEPIR